MISGYLFDKGIVLNIRMIPNVGHLFLGVGAITPNTQWYEIP